MSRALPTVLVAPRLPPRLSELPEPPQAMYLRGALPRGATVAIVGTRNASKPALLFARDLAAELASAGVAILSGGARGIDAAAHRGALSARGTTVVVAPAGFMQPYPPENAALFRRVVDEGGAYLSLVPDDQPATRGAFFSRNACLAALADVLVVVEAGFRSGARNAAAQARRLGRPVFAVPFPPWLGRGRGCLRELRAGAHLCEGPRDILEMLERLGRQPISFSKPSRRRRRPPTSPEQVALPTLLKEGEPEIVGAEPARQESRLLQLRNLMERAALSLDELVESVGLPVSEIRPLLLTLELQGGLACDPSGRFTFRKPAD